MFVSLTTLFGSHYHSNRFFPLALVLRSIDLWEITAVCRRLNQSTSHQCLQLHIVISGKKNKWMMNLIKWFLKEGGGCIFESCDIFFENAPTSCSQSALFMYSCSDSVVPLLYYVTESTISGPGRGLGTRLYSCSDSVMPLLSCTCLCNNSKWCLTSFYSPSFNSVLTCTCSAAVSLVLA